MTPRATDYRSTPGWRGKAPLNVVAAIDVDGWEEVTEKETGAFYGKPPKGGPLRPVVQFDRDIVRATHLARKASRVADADIVITLTPKQVFVEAFSRDDIEEELFYEAADRTDSLAHMLTKCAVKLVND